MTKKAYDHWAYPPNSSLPKARLSGRFSLPREPKGNRRYLFRVCRNMSVLAIRKWGLIRSGWRVFKLSFWQQFGWGNGLSTFARFWAKNFIVNKSSRRSNRVSFFSQIVCTPPFTWSIGKNFFYNVGVYPPPLPDQLEILVFLLIFFVIDRVKGGVHDLLQRLWWRIWLYSLVSWPHWCAWLSQSLSIL